MVKAFKEDIFKKKKTHSIRVRISLLLGVLRTWNEIPLDWKTTARCDECSSVAK